MKNRQSNFELLRILSMFLILLHHYSIHTGFIYEIGLSSIKFSTQILGMFGKTGVNLFVLISSYFLIESSLKKENIKEIWIITIFYSTTLTIIFSFIFKVDYSKSLLVKSLIPVSTSLYWFITAYILLYALTPLLNPIIKSLDENLLKKILLVMFIVLSLISTFLRTEIVTNELLWFIFIYLIGGYLRIHTPIIPKNKLLITTLLLILVNIISLIAMEITTKYIVLFSGKELGLLFNTQGFLPLLTAISIFLLFKEIKIKYNSVINKVASTTLAIYLIHEHPLVRKWLWSSFSKLLELNNPFEIIFFGVVFCIFVFLSCSLIEIIRQIIFRMISKIR